MEKSYFSKNKVISKTCNILEQLGILYCSLQVNGTSLEKLSHNECIDVIKRTKSPLMVEVERPLEPNMVSSGTQTLASDTLFSGVG